MRRGYPSHRARSGDLGEKGAGEMTRNPVWYTPPSEGKGMGGGWRVPADSVAFDEEGVRSGLLDLERPCFVARDGPRTGVSNVALEGEAGGDSLEVVAWAPSLPVTQLGDTAFRKAHGTRYAYYAGAMANGIASEEMVIALGRAGFLGSFGAGGLEPGRVADAVYRIGRELPDGPYAFNLIHSPSEPALERECVNLYLAHGVPCIEAAAYIDLTPYVVRYRVAGLAPGPDGGVEVRNRVIAKVSRRETAAKFMEPPPRRLVDRLLEQGLVTPEQAELSRRVPMADDITVEADSAGHTDNRPMFALLPAILALRDEIEERAGYARPIRVGAGGGIGTPEAALAAFVMGAAYVVTGSINHPCLETGTSEHAKRLLAEADVADVMMAPAADMFEMGVRLQVLKRGTLFPMRAQKLYDLYTRYASLEEIGGKEREKLERQIFRESLEAIWEKTRSFFERRDPAQIERAAENPKRKMALVFRWYLGLSSHWSVEGEPGREMDYQIWCGPSMGAFNAWVRGTYLEEVGNRRVVEVARHILTGAAYAWRVQALRAQGVGFSPACAAYRPRPFDDGDLLRKVEAP